MQGKISIIVDHRERYSGIAYLLAKMGAEVEEQQLAVGDYILSERMAVERKRATDFLDSIVKKRLFDQIGRLAAAYSKPVLIIEGEGLFFQEHECQGDLRGYGFNHSRLWLLCCDHKGRGGDSEHSLRHGRQGAVEDEKGGGSQRKQTIPFNEGEAAVCHRGASIHFCGVCKKLLDYFGSVKRVINATEKELCEVDGIGKKKAKLIKEVIERKWEEQDSKSKDV